MIQPESLIEPKPSRDSVALTIPLLRLFPGLPSGIFFSSSFFLGPILRLLANRRTDFDSGPMNTECLAIAHGTKLAVLAADR